MTHPETQKLITAVEDLTGYRVSVDTIDGIQEDARMISARPGSPIHMIRINSAHRKYADYIVAMQCSMLLVQWSNPSRVPELVPDQPKCAELGVAWAGSPSMASHPREGALRLAMAYVQGLIQQVYSMPLEIRVARICHETCPGLRELQAEKVTAHLRKLSGMFAPGFRERVPADAFDKSVVMNAAFAKAWSDLAGSRLPVIPYESTGFLDPGCKLLAALDGLAGNSAENHVATVDSWAEQLGVSGLFGWKFTNRLP